MGNVLDATGFLEIRYDLAKRIAKEVAKTQRFFIHELPNELHITKAQFDTLTGLEESKSYMSSVDLPDAILPGPVKKAYIFYTPLNAMDVVVVDDPSRNTAESGNRNG